MPSPFHQKYSSQSHKIFGDTTTNMPEGPAKDAERRASSSSAGSPPTSPTERRRSSATRFGNLEAMRQGSAERRASLSDARIGQPGVLGNLWNSFTRGTPAQKPAASNEQRDTTTLSR